MTISAARDRHTYDVPDSDDLYPSRIDPAPRWLPRLDPVVYGKRRAEGPLTGAQLDQFERDGYLFLKGYFSADEVRAFDRELTRLQRDESLRARPEAITERDSGEIRSIFRVHALSAQFDRLARSSHVAGIARQLLDSPVYIHQSRVNTKPGFRGREFFWHSDFETWHVEDGLPRMRAVSISINVTRNHEHNGPLMVIPGSHRHFISCVGETPENNYRMSLKQQVVGTPDEASVARLAQEHGIDSTVGPPGSLLLFDCNVLHASSGNISPFPRANLFFVYNSVLNRPRSPYCGRPPRPEFLSSREVRPIELVSMH